MHSHAGAWERGTLHSWHLSVFGIQFLQEKSQKVNRGLPLVVYLKKYRVTSKMKKTLINISLTILMLIHSHSYASELIEASIREVITGDHTLNIKLLKQGEVLKIKEHDKVIATIEPKDFDVKELTTYLRLISKADDTKGSIKLILIDKQGQIKATKSLSYENTGEEFALSPDSPRIPVIPRNAKVRGAAYNKKVRKNKILVQLENDMAHDHYINKVNISTNLGSVDITFTPHIAKNPYIKIEAAHDVTWANIIATTSN